MFFSSTHCSYIPPLNLYETAQGIRICSLDLNNLWLSGVCTDSLLFPCVPQMKWAAWTQTSARGSVELLWVVPTLPTPNW